MSEVLEIRIVELPRNYQQNYDNSNENQELIVNFDIVSPFTITKMRPFLQ